MSRSFLHATILAFSLGALTPAAVHGTEHQHAAAEPCHCAEISAPWARASAGAARNGAAFMTITNQSAQDERLLAASSAVAASVELHTHTMDNGVMRMRQVPEIAIPAGQSVTLQPGGLHVMFMGLKAPLKEGETIALDLTFAQAGTITVSVPVLGPAAMGADAKAGAAMDHGQHGHKSH